MNKSYIFNKIKKITAFLLILVMCITEGETAFAEITPSALRNRPQQGNDISDIEVTATAAILMEASTGKVLYEKNPDKELNPASITKIMTLLLIFEALENGRLQLTDKITVSEHAASMGGSQVFLEAGEVQDADTLIKCICLASANDGSVAMAEHIAGSEETFVNMMNTRAKELGMNHTHFVNCYGLDTNEHYTSARDVAIMSKELIVKYPEISNYTTIWMDSFVHTTSRGESTFGLNNTNKLIRSYKGITGLKTGSTGLAKYCLSATARRDGMDLVAVIMAAPDTKKRFAEAAMLLNHGFASCKLYSDTADTASVMPVAVKGGKKELLNVRQENTFSYIFTSNENISEVIRKPEINENVTAPVNEGDTVGTVRYFYKDKELGKVNIIAVETVEKAGLTDFFIKVFDMYV